MYLIFISERIVGENVSKSMDESWEGERFKNPFEFFSFKRNKEKETSILTPHGNLGR